MLVDGQDRIYNWAGINSPILSEYPAHTFQQSYLVSLKFLLVVLTLAMLSACGGSTENADSEDDDFSALDSDGDGLTNRDEIELYDTSPELADTDGDGISDGDEIIEFGFDAAVNNFRFNPLIADLPGIAIRFETVPEIVLNYTTSEGDSREVTNSNGGAVVDIDTFTHTSSLSVTVGVEAEVSGAIFGPTATGRKSIEVDVSQEFAYEDSTEETRDWERAVSESKSSDITNDSATIRVGVSIENPSNLALTLQSLTLTASYFDRDSNKIPIATLIYSDSGFPTSLDPGERTALLNFENSDLSLGTALSLFEKDVRRLEVETALSELVDENGIPIAFSRGEVDAKTALVIIDYGITRPVENYQAAILGSLGDGTLSIAMLLDEILHVDYSADDEGIQTVRTVGGIQRSRWVVAVTHDDGFGDQTVFYDNPEEADYDEAAVVVYPYNLASVMVYPGDQVQIVFLTDPDGDTVGIREEYLHGTDPEDADSDDDGLTDDVEIREAYRVEAINAEDPDRYPADVYSNPVLADADEDGLDDFQERERGLDPNNADTDGDGVPDGSDAFEGGNPVAAILRLIPSGADALEITGTVTPRTDTMINRIEVDWGDDSPSDVQLHNAGEILSINFSAHEYELTTQDESAYDITVTVTYDDVETAVFVGEARFFREIFFEAFTAEGGWNARQHIREVADVNNDGLADLVGYGASHVLVALGTGAGFEAPESWINNYGPSQGWTKINHPRVLLDWDNDGLVDIVGFASTATIWSKNNGAGFDAAEVIVEDFSVAQGWTGADLRTFAKVNSDVYFDIVGADQSGVKTFLGGITSNSVISANDAFGSEFWDDNYRLLGDLDGDGRDDILGLGRADPIYALGQPDGTFSAAEIAWESEEFTGTWGWDAYLHPVWLTDVNNDAMPDVVGVGNGPVRVKINESTPGNLSFTDSQSWGGQFSVTHGWNPPYNPRFIEDINGDGFGDIIGFNRDGAIGALNVENTLATDIANRKFDTQAVYSENIDSGIDFRLPAIGGVLMNERYVRDINNDGRADLVGFSNDGVVVQRMPAITQPVLQ